MEWDAAEKAVRLQRGHLDALTRSTMGPHALLSSPHPLKSNVSPLAGSRTGKGKQLAIMPGSRSYAVVLEPDADRGFTAIVPALPGVVTEGDTVEEVFANVREAIELCLEDLAAQGLEIPESDPGARLEWIEIPAAS